MNDRRERMRMIFDQARSLPRPERAAFLDGLAGVDGSMRAQIEDMLAALDEAGSFLSEPTQAREGDGGATDPRAPTLIAPLREGPGTHIGPYKILQTIGEGGFGTVFMAEQAKPVLRKVALKIIKLGMDTRQVVARFEQERQALAMMDHPGIAKVFDAGATETGRPFFVMELVRGDPIVEYCDKHSLSIKERLDLFMQVCSAVQHAHTKGIIHRDIKPSNILVSTQDDRPHAKVIDFGIAKATASKLTEKTLFTEHRTLIGTPEYMSPEQAEGDLDIDTRSDVYSLGVLLYELLTGTTPFSSNELRSAAYAEIQRIIREVEPPKPSTRLSSNTDSLASVAARRHTEPSRLGTMIRGELDWIVMKALEKDRQRRYETATHLGADIRRYLAGDPVHAAPPSANYRLRKFVRRHRASVVLASAIAATLVVGLAGTSVGLLWAVREKDRADLSARAADLAKTEAQDRTKDLERAVSFQASQLSGVDVMQMGIRFRKDVLDGIRLAGANTKTPAPKVEADVAAVDGVLATIDLTGIARSALESGILAPSLTAIRREFAEQPRVRADLLSSVSESARRLGSFEIADQPGLEAIQVHSADSGPRSIKTLKARMHHALLLKDRGRLDDSEAEMREILSLSVAEHGESSRITVDLRASLATVLAARSKFQECEDLYRTSLAWYREHAGLGDPDTSVCMASYALTLSNLGRLDEAEPLLSESVDGCRAAYGPTHLRTLQALNGLAGFYRNKKDYERSLAVFNDALETSRRSLGEDHWLTLMLIDNIGGVRFAQGQRESAAAYARTALEGRARTLGESHPATLRSCYNLGRVLEGQGDPDEVIRLYRRAADGFRIAYGEFHGHTISARNSLAGALLNAGRYQECADLLLGELDVIGRQTVAPAERHRAVVRALGTLYEKWDGAEPGRGHAEKAAEWKAKLATLPEPKAAPADGRN